MLGITFRRLYGVSQRPVPGIVHHCRPLATTSRYRPVPKLNTVLPRWQSSAAVGALRAVDSESTIPSIEEEIISTSVVLRPYQEAAITSCREALSSGLTRLGVSSPTGSGKTTMFMSLIPKVSDQGERTRTLILVSSVDLASQAEGAARRMLGPGFRIEVEQGKRIASGTADVTIGTYQTLNNVERLKKFDPSKFKLVIVDEAHHAAAFSYLRLLNYFNDGVQLPSMLSPINDPAQRNQVPVIGFSATFSRPDQLALSAVFEKIVFHREVTSMLEEGWLSPARSTTIQCDLHLDQVEVNATGDFKTSSLAPHVNTPTINDLIVRSYLHRAGDRRSTLIFCVDLSHVANVTHAFREAGIDARSVSSISAGKSRKETLDAFANGEFPVLVNCEVLTEGTDIPVIDCIILARPTKSRNLLAQMVGRGLRLSPETEKEDCLIVDVVDNVGRANGMLVSPTLFGLTHDELAEEERERKEAKECDGEAAASATPGESTPRVRKVTFVDEDDPFRVASSSRPPIARMSSNAWVACGGDRYILELLGKGYISVDPNESEDEGEGKWTVKYRYKIQIGAGAAGWFSRVTNVATADDLERAMQTSDKYAEKTLGRAAYSQISRYAEWRQRPASPRAMTALLKMKGIKGVRDIEIMGKVVKVDRLKAGEVASYICAATHGAMTHRKKRDQASARQAQREQVKAEKARAAEARNLPLPSSV